MVRTATSESILPETIADQIKLWETERNRLKASLGVLWYMFSTVEEYARAKKAAEDFNVLIWCDDVKWKLFLTPEGDETVKSVLRPGK